MKKPKHFNYHNFWDAFYKAIGIQNYGKSSYAFYAPFTILVYETASYDDIA